MKPSTSQNKLVLQISRIDPFHVPDQDPHRESDPHRYGSDIDPRPEIDYHHVPDYQEVHHPDLDPRPEIDYHIDTNPDLDPHPIINLKSIANMKTATMKIYTVTRKTKRDSVR